MSSPGPAVQHTPSRKSDRLRPADEAGLSVKRTTSRKSTRAGVPDEAPRRSGPRGERAVLERRRARSAPVEPTSDWAKRLQSSLRAQSQRKGKPSGAGKLVSSVSSSSLEQLVDKNTLAMTARQAHVLRKKWHTPRRLDLIELTHNMRLHIDEFRLGPIIGKGTFSHVRMVHPKHAETENPPPLALKTMGKMRLLSAGQVAHVHAEKALLNMVQCPFVVAFLACFQDSRRLFFLLEYVHGGELYSRLKREGRLLTDTAKLYAAELALAFHYLHGVGVAYRDLKPENVMLDREGHVKLVDFGFAKFLNNNQTFTIVGTPEYLAPEILKSSGHGVEVDDWALGVLMYEMLAGYPPFFADDPYSIYKKILDLEIKYPRHFDVKATNLIGQLLVAEVGNRLNPTGCMRHIWFDEVDWIALWGKEVRPKWIPYVAFPDDLRLFEVPVEENRAHPAPDSFEVAGLVKLEGNRQFEDF